MSRVVQCDICGHICQGQQFFSLTAWHGKGEHVSKKGKRNEGWKIKRRDDIEGRSADVCSDCMSDRVGISDFQAVKTTKTREAEIKAQNPDMSALVLLRHLAGGYYSVTVICDQCGAECMDKHLRATSAWLTAGGEELITEVCEACVEGKFQPITKFQVVPPKPVPQKAAVG